MDARLYQEAADERTSMGHGDQRIPLEKCNTIKAVTATNGMDELKAGIQDPFVDALLGYGTDLTARVECGQPNGLTHT